MVALSSDDANSMPPSFIFDLNETANECVLPCAQQIRIVKCQAWGRGIANDFKNTIGTHWKDEMTNCNMKTISVSLLVFISVVAPTLTIGAISSSKLDNHIGVVETVVATAWTGIFCSLFSGMPMVFMGPTNVVLMLTTVIYEIAKEHEIPFLPFYAWISVWMFGFTTTAAFFDLTRYIRYATRFTDEIYVLMMVVFFIFYSLGNPFRESSDGILSYFHSKHTLHETNADIFAVNERPEVDYEWLEVALVSFILGFGTTLFIFALRSVKTSSFFCSQGIRDLVHDLAVTSAVSVMSLIQNLGFGSIQVQRLQVPDQFEPTFSCCDNSCSTMWPNECLEQSAPFRTRPWFADMSNVGGMWWVPLAAAGPAAMAFILLYFDDCLTWHLLHSPGSNLKHGESYNWDLLLNGVCNLVNGLLGMPWMAPALMPTIAQADNLSTRDESGGVVEVQETRLTNLFCHVLLGISLKFLHVIALIPVPVLLGVFLFLGISSLSGLQFWLRVLMFFQQPSKHSPTPYNQHVRKRRVHLYTLIQLLFFSSLLAVTMVKKVAIFFPFVVLLFIPARLFLMPTIFAGWELLLLDGHPEGIERWLNAKRTLAIGKVLSIEDVDDTSRTEDDDDFYDEISLHDNDWDEDTDANSMGATLGLEVGTVVDV